MLIFYHKIDAKEMLKMLYFWNWKVIETTLLTHLVQWTVWFQTSRPSKQNHFLKLLSFYHICVLNDFFFKYEWFFRRICTYWVPNCMQKKVLLKVNNIAAGKGKSLMSFCRRRDLFLCVCGILHNIIRNIYEWFLTQFFNTVHFFSKIKR